jgi:four helix bundle protein
MARDPRKLRVFALADALVPDIYQATKGFPSEERYGLVAQMRRAAVSIATNIVEGCARRTTKDYLNFLTVANGSAYELTYLLGLSTRLGMLAEQASESLSTRSGEIAAGLTALIKALENAP